MGEQSKKITVYIFLLVVFFLLAFFIAARLYKDYYSSTQYSDETTKNSLQCNFFSFSISKISYLDGVLAFDLTLKVSEEKNTPKKMVIESETQTYEVETGQALDFTQRLTSRIPLTGSFIIYPDGCKGFNQKTCDIASGKCQVS